MKLLPVCHAIAQDRVDFAHSGPGAARLKEDLNNVVRRRDFSV